MEVFWNSLLEKRKAITLKPDEHELFNRFGKAIANLSANPKQPGLKTYEIEPLSKKYDLKYGNRNWIREKQQGVFIGYMAQIEKRLPFWD